MPIPTHLNEGDYPKAFPPALDEFPTLVNEEHYIDAWHLNTIFNSLLATEQYLIDHQGNIEAPLGDDVLGIEGELEIAIPPARYLPYHFAMAWDSDLLEENIKAGVNIFGVVGSLAAGAGGIAVSIPAVAAIADGWVYRTPPTLTIDAAVPAVAVPAVSAT